MLFAANCVSLDSPSAANSSLHLFVAAAIHMPPTIKARKPKSRGPRPRAKVLQRLIENDLIRKISYDEYRDKVQRVYGGPKGAILSVCSVMSLHVPLGERIFRTRR